LVSPKEVKRENKKLVYEKPVLIGLGDTLDLGLGACAQGSLVTGDCTPGYTPSSKCTTGFSPSKCSPGSGRI
jgi:hypothetical protein